MLSAGGPSDPAALPSVQTHLPPQPQQYALTATDYKWEYPDTVMQNSTTGIPNAQKVEGSGMKVKVTLYVAGNVFHEVVEARDYKDAKQTALARNPTARVVSVTGIF